MSECRGTVGTPIDSGTPMADPHRAARRAASTTAIPVHVIVCTHTTRHLGPCLASLRLQTQAPASIAVSCDTDDRDLAGLLDTHWPRIAALRPGPPPPLLHVYRPAQGEARLNQVRNNALRALEETVRPAEGDLVVVLDGDTLLEERAIERHARAASRGREIVIPYRINLGEPATARITTEAMLSSEWTLCGGLGAIARPEDLAGLRRRDRRYRGQLLLRSLVPAWSGLVKAHKPKILGGHHAVRVRALRAVNGYDEEYVGYGYDDDDLSRRLYGARPRPSIAVAVADILAFHLWHPSRAPERPTMALGYARFRRDDLPIRAHHGWDRPIDQPRAMVRLVSPLPPSAGQAATTQRASGASPSAARRVGAA